MYRECNIGAGLPERIYRSPIEIKRDINGISAKIKDASERLNLRALLLDLVDLSRTAANEPSVWIPELTDAINEARSAYEGLSLLKEELSQLREELREVRWAICV